MPQLVPFYWDAQLCWGYALVAMLTYFSAVYTLPGLLRLFTSRQVITLM